MRGGRRADRARVRGREGGRLSLPAGAALARCRAQLGEDAPPAITIHDMRLTHASLLLSAGEPVKTVSERLGHASVTLAVYGHVMPGDQKRAATRTRRALIPAGASD